MCKEIRKKEFKYFKCMMDRRQIEEKINLFNSYIDVLDNSDKKELKRLKKEKDSFIILGTLK